MALQGTLETFALADVLRLLASTKKVGTLRIDGDRGFGHLLVLDGELVGASASGSPLAQRPAEVLFELLRYETGAFVFDAEAEVSEGEHRVTVEEALADAEEQLREWREIEAVVPSSTCTVNLVRNIEGREITLTAVQWEAVVALGEGATPIELGERLGLAELPASRMVRDLVELGAAEIGEETEPVSAEGDSSLAVEVPEPPITAPEANLGSSEEELTGFQPQIVPDPPSSPPPPPLEAPSSGGISFDDAPSLLAEPSPPPASSSGPLLDSSASPSAFAPPSAAFAPPTTEPNLDQHTDPGSAFAPLDGPVDSWNAEEDIGDFHSDDDDGLGGFHSDDDPVPLFGGSPNAPGPDDPFGPDPFTIPNFDTLPQDSKDSEEAAELARQLANLSPRAQQAVAAAAAARTDEERDEAIEQAEQASEEPINRNLLIKYLSSVDE